MIQKIVPWLVAGCALVAVLLYLLVNYSEWQNSTSSSGIQGPPAGVDAKRSGPQGKIVFTDRIDGHSALFTVLSDGSDRHLIYKHINTVNSNVISPKWVDDGKIRFHAMHGQYENGSTPEWREFLINEDGTGLTVLDGISLPPMTEQLGKELFFETSALDNNIYHLMYGSSQGKVIIDTINLTSCVCMCDPSFDIAYAQMTSNNDHVIIERNHQIFAVNSDGDNYRRVSRGSDPNWRDYGGPPGKMLAEVADEDEPERDARGEYRVTDADRAGYIKRIYVENGKQYVNFDEIGFFYNDRCMDGYYIDLGDDTVQKLEVASDATIKLTGFNFRGKADVPNLAPSFLSFRMLFGENKDCASNKTEDFSVSCHIPFWIVQSASGTVEKIIEQYIP